jgi:hypothetical protein
LIKRGRAFLSHELRRRRVFEGAYRVWEGFEILRVPGRIRA